MDNQNNINFGNNQYIKDAESDNEDTEKVNEMPDYVKDDVENNQSSSGDSSNSGSSSDSGEGDSESSDEESEVKISTMEAQIEVISLRFPVF